MRNLFFILSVCVLSLLHANNVDAQWNQNPLILKGSSGKCSVSLTPDGTKAIVGGAVHTRAEVYSFSNGTYTQEIIDGQEISLGNIYNVGLSADGNTAILGGSFRSHAFAMVFTRIAGQWPHDGIQLSTSISDGSVSRTSLESYNVALSADGGTAICGGIGTEGTRGVVAAHFFSCSSGTWKQQGTELLGSNYNGLSNQDASVAISADGSTAVIGGYHDGKDTGAVWIFARSNGVWKQQGSKLVGTGNTVESQQGFSVSLSYDGNIALVGAPNDNHGTGAAWIFKRMNGSEVWTQQGSKLTSKTLAQKFGISVALSGDGCTAVIGCYRGIETFTGYGGVWTQVGPKFGLDIGESNSIALSANGFVAIVAGSKTSYLFNFISTPELTSIADIPADQGGKVRVTWNKSILDNPRDYNQIIQYGLWRKINTGETPPLLTIKPLAKTANDTLGTLYDFIASVPAVQSPTYNFIAPTLSDSSGNGIHQTTFVVTAHTSDPNLYFFSNQADGHSIDNIPPIGISGESIASLPNGKMLLNWQADIFDTDLKGYRIYRSIKQGFVIGESTSIAFTSDTTYTDTTAAHGLMSYYRIAAVDLHDNVGQPSAELGGTPTGVGFEEQTAPKEFSLSQNYPNPFNPNTVIKFSIRTYSHTSLRVYDMLGREVATLVNESKPAGSYQVQWNAASIPSGVYFYRITSGSFSETKKLILLK